MDGHFWANSIPILQKPWFSSPHSLLANYYKIQTRNFLVCHTQSRKLPLTWGEGADTAAVWRGSSLKSKRALSHALWLHSWPMVPGFIGKFPVSPSQKECCTFWLSLTTEDPLFIPYYSQWWLVSHKISKIPDELSNHILFAFLIQN